MPPTFQTLPLGAVKPAGWILAQLRRDLRDGFAGCLDTLTERARSDLFLNRIESSAQQFAWWDSETRGNWLWGYTMMAYLADLPEHQARVTALVKALKKTQDPDGYLGIYSPASRYQHGEGENGELWGQGRALLTLLAYYELTGDRTCLTTAQAAADLTLKHYGPGRPYFRRSQQPEGLIGLTHGLCYVDVVEWLYTITGDPRYRDFGVWLYEDFSRMPVPFANDDLTLGYLAQPHRPLQGHAVHAVEHLRALLWAEAHGHRPDYGAALQSALRKIRHSALPSGAVIGDEGLHGLPLPDSGYEYCTLTELLFSLTSALQKSGDRAFGDWAETLAFNAGQGARLADGRALGYLSLDTRLHATLNRPDSYSNLDHKHGRFKYSPTHEDVACCCNPNAVRFMPHYLSRMWMRLAGRPGLAAVLYGPCTVTTAINGVPVTIVEETDYPFSETLRFTLKPERAVDFAFCLRKPEWAEAATISGTPVSDEAGYVIIEKTWAPGEMVTVTFTARVNVVSYPNGEVGVRRGALQYVWPVAHTLHPVKDYSVKSFHDFEAYPVDLVQAYAPLILDESRPDYGLAFETNPDVDLNQCWAQAPVQLNTGATPLIPLGCTVLRRAAFPLKRA
jgi:uncharacterized protein